MHYKKKNISERVHSIQGLRPVSKTLPKGLKTILKKGGYNYSTIINNWTQLVGKKISDISYPRSIKTGKDLKNGVLILNVNHGDQLLVEYSKKEIVDKINTFFGYQFIKEVKISLIKNKIIQKNSYLRKKERILKYEDKINKISDTNLRKNLSSLIDAFGKRKRSNND